MNFIEAAKSGKVFCHPQSIGAYIVYKDVLIHSDYPEQLLNQDFLESKIRNAPEIHAWIPFKNLLDDNWDYYHE